LVEEQSGKHMRGIGPYYRPIGGTIEYGERSSDTVVREFREEISMEVEVVSYLGCIENIFSVDGETGHDIDHVYVVRPIDEQLRSNEMFPVIEGDRTTIAKWVQLEVFHAGKLPLYPDGLLDLIKPTVLIDTDAG